MTTGLDNEFTRMQLSYAICKAFTVAIEEDYTSYDAWEAIEDDLHVTPEEIETLLKNILDSKKTGFSFSMDSSVSANLVMIGNWLYSFSMETLELFYADIKADLVLIAHNRDLEQSFKDNLVSFYCSVLANTTTQDGCIVCPVSKRQRRIIKKVCGLDIKATDNFLATQVTNHIISHHGVKGSHDKSMAVPSNMGQIVDVLMHSDSAELSSYHSGELRFHKRFLSKHGSPSVEILFKKKMPDGYVCVVLEAMTDTKKGVLRIVTAYRHK
ncbi:MAG: hypothetical protein LUD51_08195 [Clostridia bacterium]|nr:hypothetical protein [Clostridia bacterium]